MKFVAVKEKIKTQIGSYSKQLKEKITFQFLKPKVLESSGESTKNSWSGLIGQGIKSISKIRDLRLFKFYNSVTSKLDKAPALMTPTEVLTTDETTPTKTVKKAKAPKKTPKGKKKPRGIALFANWKNPNPMINFTKVGNKDLNPEEQKAIQDLVPPDFDISFRHLSFSSSGKSKARKIAHTPSGRIFSEHMVTGNGVVISLQSTPTKDKEVKVSDSPHRMKFKTIDTNGNEVLEPLHADESSKVCDFEYTVTKTDIQKRMGVSRPCPQKKLCNNVSGYDYLVAIGAELKDIERRFIHIPHRQAFSQGGAQDSSNVDPASTAGSNYATLFEVEEPIRKMLFEGAHGIPPVKSVHVKGKVVYAATKNVPFKMVYTLHWGENSSLEVTIDPLNFRGPTMKENQAAVLAWAIAMDKEFPAPKKLDLDSGDEDEKPIGPSCKS